MAKTVTIRLDDDIYGIFKKAAQGNKRTISNFLEYAALAFLSNDAYADDDEMDAILEDSALMKALRKGRKEIAAGEYDIVS